MRVVPLLLVLGVGVGMAAGCGSSGDQASGTGGHHDGGVGGSANGTGTGGGANGTGTGGAGNGTGTGGAGNGTGTGGAGNGTGTGGAGNGTGTGGAGNGTGTGGAGNGTGTGGTGATCNVAQCQSHVYQCGDCIDNDGDGLVDMADPDCLGPCDNTEDSYYGGIPGQNNAPCKMDCYFDQDTGAGNDGCYWSHKCDPLEVAPGYPPEGSSCAYDHNANIPGASCTGNCCDQYYAAQSAQCGTFCGNLTPNGCDCFGCCELPAGGGKYVWLGSTDAAGNGTCTLADVTDPAKCHPCTPVKGCLNTCEHCELCLGKTQLPADCFPPPSGGGGAGGTTSGGGGTTSGGGGTTSGGGGTTSGGGGTTSGGGGTSGSGGTCGGQLCPVGHQACGLSCQPPCPVGSFCLTGCCNPLPA